ncbi:MAG: hypothetical protein ACYTGZ_02465 [Planctomycetota bacterium]
MKGGLEPVIVDWSTKASPRVFWPTLKRPGNRWDYTARPIDPEFLGEHYWEGKKPKLKCTTKLDFEFDRCGRVCRTYEVACRPTATHRGSRFKRWRDVTYKWNPPRHERGLDRSSPVVRDRWGRTDPEIAWDEELVAWRNEYLWNAIVEELERRGCPIDCPVQVTAPKFRLIEGELGGTGEGAIDDATGEWKARFEICMTCNPPFMPFPQSLPVPRAPAEMDRAHIYWVAINPPCSQREFKTALSACVYLRSVRTRTKGYMAKRAKKILDSFADDQLNEEMEKVHCVPEEECDIVWKLASRDHSRYTRKLAGKGNIGSTIVYCRNWEAKCVAIAGQCDVDVHGGALPWATGACGTSGTIRWSQAMTRGSAESDAGHGVKIGTDQNRMLSETTKSPMLQFRAASAWARRAIGTEEDRPLGHRRDDAGDGARAPRV